MKPPTLNKLNHSIHDACNRYERRLRHVKTMQAKGIYTVVKDIENDVTDLFYNMTLNSKP